MNKFSNLFKENIPLKKKNLVSAFSETLGFLTECYLQVINIFKVFIGIDIVVVKPNFAARIF